MDDNQLIVTLIFAFLGAISYFFLSKLRKKKLGEKDASENKRIPTDKSGNILASNLEPSSPTPRSPISKGHEIPKEVNEN